MVCSCDGCGPSDLFFGAGLPADTSIRDSFASLSDALARAGTDLRVMVPAHNNHIQKSPVSFDGELTTLPMGYYLSREVGDRYRAVGLTNLGHRVPEMSFPRPESPVGFAVTTVEIPFPTPGSIEHALIEAGL